jgi:hypothetical protein
VRAVGRCASVSSARRSSGVHSRFLKFTRRRAAATSATDIGLPSSATTTLGTSPPSGWRTAARSCPRSSRSPVLRSAMGPNFLFTSSRRMSLSAEARLSAPKKANGGSARKHLLIGTSEGAEGARKGSVTVPLLTWGRPPVTPFGVPTRTAKRNEQKRRGGAQKSGIVVPPGSAC